MLGLFLLPVLLLPLANGFIITDSECTDSTKIYYIPNPANCSEYFECVRGTKFVEACPAGLVWDQINSVCDYNDYVGCTPTTTPVTTTTSDPMCPSTGIINVYYPYDCSKYYHCVNGQKTIKTCPENLYFDPISSTCIYMDLVDCKVTPTSAPDTSTTSTTTTSTSTTTTTSNPVTDDPLCPSGITVNLVYPYDCAKFYHCVNGQKTLKTCPENLYFDPVTLTCLYMDEVDCTATPTPPPDTSSTSTSTTTTSTPTPAPESTTTTSSSTTTATTSSSVTNDPLCPSSETMNVVYPYDCSKYYHCVNGQKTLQTCPENLYFNPTTARCDYMDLVDCNVTTTMSPSTQTTPTRSTATTITPSSKTTTTTRTTTQSTTTESTDLCEGKPNGTYLADPASCRRFIECSNGKGTSLPCPQGTIWDESITSCVNSDSQCT